MERGRIILIGLAIAGMIAAVVFFAFLIKRPVSEENQAGGLPVSPSQSFTQPVPGATTPPPGGASPGAEAPGTEVLPGVSAHASVFLPPSLPSQQAAVGISGTVLKPPTLPALSASDQAVLGQMIGRLGLKDQSGNQLTPQQLLSSQNNLPLPLQQLMQKPGGPTIADMEKLIAQSQAQFNTLSRKISEFQSLAQGGSIPAEQCQEIFNDLQNFVSTWGSGAAKSISLPISACSTQFPGLPGL